MGAQVKMECMTVYGTKQWIEIDKNLEKMRKGNQLGNKWVPGAARRVPGA